MENIQINVDTATKMARSTESIAQFLADFATGYNGAVIINQADMYKIIGHVTECFYEKLDIIGSQLREKNGFMLSGIASDNGEFETFLISKADDATAIDVLDEQIKAYTFSMVPAPSGCSEGACTVCGNLEEKGEGEFGNEDEEMPSNEEQKDAFKSEIAYLKTDRKIFRKMYKKDRKKIKTTVKKSKVKKALKDLKAHWKTDDRDIKNMLKHTKAELKAVKKAIKAEQKAEKAA